MPKICNLVSQKKIVPNQLICCNFFTNECNNNTSECFTYLGSETDPRNSLLTLCHEISTISACQERPDATARAVCDKKDSLYCLLGHLPDKESANGSLINRVYPHLFAANKWALNRTYFKDSLKNVGACYSEEEQEYSSFCSTNRDLVCNEDFFQTEKDSDCELINNNLLSKPSPLDVAKLFCKNPNWVNDTTDQPPENDVTKSDKELSKGTIIIAISVTTLVVILISVWLGWRKLRLIYQKKPLHNVIYNIFIIGVRKSVANKGNFNPQANVENQNDFENNNNEERNSIELQSLNKFQYQVEHNVSQQALFSSVTR